IVQNFFLRIKRFNNHGNQSHFQSRLKLESFSQFCGEKRGHNSKEGSPAQKVSHFAAQFPRAATCKDKLDSSFFFNQCMNHRQQTWSPLNLIQNQYPAQREGVDNLPYPLWSCEIHSLLLRHEEVNSS